MGRQPGKQACIKQRGLAGGSHCLALDCLSVSKPADRHAKRLCLTSRACHEQLVPPSLLQRTGPSARCTRQTA